MITSWYRRGGLEEGMSHNEDCMSYSKNNKCEVGTMANYLGKCQYPIGCKCQHAYSNAIAGHIQNKLR